MKKLFLSLITLLTLATAPLAQAQDGGGGDDPLTGAAMQDVWIVVGTGGMGAILGLSTLSFVEEPKDHLKNIVVGGAIGIIIGVGIVAWRTANKSKDIYEGGSESYNVRPEFDTKQRYSWHNKTHQSINQAYDSKVSAFQYQFSF